MKVLKIDPKEWSYSLEIHWLETFPLRMYAPGKSFPKTTTCRIYFTYNDSRDSGKILMAEEFCVKHRLDKDNPTHAQKITLVKALKTVYFTKEQRAYCMKEFFKSLENEL